MAADPDLMVRSIALAMHLEPWATHRGFILRDAAEGAAPQDEAEEELIDALS
jgi:hypothetical protein